MILLSPQQRTLGHPKSYPRSVEGSQALRMLPPLPLLNSEARRFQGAAILTSSSPPAAVTVDAEHVASGSTYGPLLPGSTAQKRGRGLTGLKPRCGPAWLPLDVRSCRGRPGPWPRPVAPSSIFEASNGAG